MEIKLMEPDNLRKLLGEMDADCAARTVLAALSGKKKFIAQLTLECGIMNQRNKDQDNEEVELIDE